MTSPAATLLPKHAHTCSHTLPSKVETLCPLSQDPEIQAMTSLVEAYQRNDIKEFEKVLKSNR